MKMPLQVTFCPSNLHQYICVTHCEFCPSLAAFLFFNFLLSIMASFFALRAIDEIKQKQKEEHTRLSVLSDTLHYDLDNP